MIRANIETTVSPIVGNEKQSEDMVNYLLQEFEGDTAKIWQSNIFGRSFHEIVSEDLQAKLKRMPDDARSKAPPDARAHHQRGQRGPHLHHSLKIAKRGEIPLSFLHFVTKMFPLCNLCFRLLHAILFT